MSENPVKSKRFLWTGIISGVATLLLGCCLLGIFWEPAPIIIPVDDRVHIEVLYPHGLQEHVEVYEYRVVDKQARETSFVSFIYIDLDSKEKLPSLIPVRTKNRNIIAVVDKNHPTVIYIFYDLNTHLSWAAHEGPNEQSKAMLEQFEREIGERGYRLGENL